MSAHFKSEERLVLRPAGALAGSQLVEAQFFRHRFPPHGHDFYVLAAVAQGVEGIHHRGTLHRGGTGSLVLLGPEEIHTGFAGADGAWGYQGIYASAAPGPRARRRAERTSAPLRRTGSP